MSLKPIETTDRPGRSRQWVHTLEGVHPATKGTAPCDTTWMRMARSKYLSTIIFIYSGVEHATFGINAWLYMGKI
jgi:hypothetical protein